MCKSIPLKIAMAGLFALITAVAVVVAFVPTTVIGIDSHRRTATSLHQRTTQFVRQSIATLLSPPTDLYDSIRLLQQQGAIDDGVFTPVIISNATDDRARRLLASVKGLTRTSAGLLVSRVFTYAPGAFRYYGAGDQGEGTPISSYTVQQNGTYTFETNDTSDVLRDYTTFLDIAYIEALDEIQVAKNISVNYKVVCSPRLVLGFIGVAISCAYRTPDPRFAGNFVYSGIVLEASFLVTLLKSIDRLTPNAKIALAHGTSKQVMALSWGEDTQIKLPGWADESLPTSQRFATKVLTDVQDSTVRGALDAVGGQNGLSTLHLPFFKKITIDKDPVYVDVNEFRDDKVGLHLFLILTVPESDFLGEMNRMTNITIGVVCAMFAVLIALGFLFAWCLVRPLEDLGDRMQLTASLQDDTEKSSLSTFTEIRRLQGSYNTMREHLNAMKSYLPQSVIQSLLISSSTEDDQENEADNAEDSMILHSEVDLSASEASNASRSARPSGFGAAASGNLSESHRRTRKSGVSSGGGSTVRNKRNAPTNISTNVKLVSILALNVRKTHSAWAGSSSGGAVVGLQQVFLSCMLKHVAECRGTVDTFQGDRVVISFNAVRSVAAHGRMAATAGWGIITDLARNGVWVTAGMSTGRALVGNMGVSDMMKFNIIGPVVNEAIGLERCARIMNGPPIGDTEVSPTERRAISGQFPNSTPLFMHNSVPVLSEIQGSFQLQPVEVAWRRVPKSLSTAAERERVVVMSVNRQVTESAGADEWMYELAEQQVCNPCAPLTEAYLKLASGDAEGAASLLNDIVSTSKVDVDSPDHIMVSEATAHLRYIIDSQISNYAGWWL